MKLSTEKRKEIIKDIKIYIDEIDYMKRKTIDIDTLPDDVLMKVHEYVLHLWWEFIKLS
jgi:hypothetical protein